MRYALILLLFLAACEDRYRYECQNPKHFALKKCQRPDCQFTQDCPDYLVAPILEKQVVQPPQIPNQSASEPRGNWDTSLGLRSPNRNNHPCWYRDLYAV